MLKKKYHQVFCDDPNQLVLDILAHRGMDPQNSDVHCGIDGGQGSLKIGITVTEKGTKKLGRAHYSDVGFKF